jgi:hypothetical protein
MVQTPEVRDGRDAASRLNCTRRPPVAPSRPNRSPRVMSPDKQTGPVCATGSNK